MKRRTFLLPLASLAVCTLALGAQQASDKELMQQYFEKFGPPGPEHKLLEPLVGNWHASCKMWMDPSSQPQASEGTLTRKSIFDGRFIQEEFAGKFMDKPFKGQGTMGYDRAKRKFVASWIDSVSTALHVSYGDYDQSARTWTFKHEEDCPITGKRVKTRDLVRIVSPDEQQLEMFRQMGEEKEVRVMEIRLTRK